MRRSLNVPLLVMLFISSPVAAQTKEQQIEEALLPLPESLRAEATVIAEGPGTERSVLREGTNKWICETDEPAAGFNVSCHHAGLEPYNQRNQELTAQGKGSEERFSILAAEVKAGKLEIPQGATVFILAGTNRETALPLTVVRVPFATAESTGLPTESDGRRPWLMRAGTVAAHIMFPGT